VRDGWDLFQREPTVTFVSRHVLPRVDVPYYKHVRQDALHSNGECLRLDVVRAAVLCMGAVSIVNDNVCERFRECWHEKFGMFCDFL
jgi:hypothetical protein